MAQKNWAVDLNAGIRFSEGIDRTAPASLLADAGADAGQKK
jgi:hypothetical protein